jgi:pimeloyl-ACP methyl ester carboxylesterase
VTPMATPPDLTWIPAAERVIDGAGLALHTVQGSSGPSVVLVHGIEGMYDEWTAVAAHLADRYTVHSLDMPWRAGGAYLWDRSGTAAGFLRAGLEMVDAPLGAVIGHSFGANTLLRLMAEAPGTDTLRFAAAGAIGPFYLPEPVNVTWKDFDRARHGFSEVIAQGVRVRLGERDARIDDELRALMLNKVLDRIGPFGFHAFFQQYLASAELDLSVVEVPTLVVGGHDEELFTQDRADAMAKAMPAATVVFQHHLSHFCHIEQPDLLLPYIDGLLQARVGEA